MKLVLALWLLTGCAYAQSPARQVRRDSIPTIFPPDVHLPGRSEDRVSVDSPERMPNARPNNSFYRYYSDPANVMRATMDNMPVKVPDSSIHYTMLRSYQKYVRPEKPPMQFLEPMPRIVPKKFR